MNAPIAAPPIPSPLTLRRSAERSLEGTGEGKGGGKGEGRGGVLPPSPRPEVESFRRPHPEEQRENAKAAGGEGPEAVVAFWCEAGPKMWFAKDPAFDQIFRRRFIAAHNATTRGECSGWLRSPAGALALILLLDQFPRNAFRGTPRMYETDTMARFVADAALALGHDRAIEPMLRGFLYLPFGHSEDFLDQKRAVELIRPLGEEWLKPAERHCDLIARFGRFPHRNAILGRAMRAEEQMYLDAGGFQG